MFSRLYQRLARFQGDIIAFQIGDTHVAPPVAGRLGALGFSTEHDPDVYAYSPPQGDTELVEAVAAKVKAKNRMSFASADNVQITNGATHALSCSVRAVLDPGDEILLLAPYWPLIQGIALSCCVRPVEVPFSHHLLRATDDALRARVHQLIEPHINARTAAIYLCTPNNPDGMVFSPVVLGAIADLVQRHGLWVLADEVYEEFTYEGREHISMASLPGMAERTITSFSFSKSYAQAGLRVGYVIGPAQVMEAVRRMANASVYSVSRAMQRAALRAMVSGDPFLAETRQRYQHARDHALARVQAPCTTPQGSTYLFLDFSEWIGDEHRSALCLLEKMAEEGLLLAPGAAFGAHFGNWARMCFTAVDALRLDEGIDRLNRVLDAARKRP
jgi:aspartate/methionine/tyrosine aminotransferase